MSSQFEEVGNQILGNAPDLLIKGTRETAHAIKESFAIGTSLGGKTIRGICLILDKGTEFTTQTVMKAVKDVAYNRTGNVEYSNQNIDMVQLQKSGQVTKIDEKITEDVMKHFNDQCKKYGVKYSAMKDERDPKNPAYMIFYNGKSADIILQVMKEAYKDYSEAQKSQSVQTKGKKILVKKEQEGKRESVRAKLTFFRNRVADREEQKETLEKNVRHSDRQR